MKLTLAILLLLSPLQSIAKEFSPQEKASLKKLMFYREWMGAKNYAQLLKETVKQPCQEILKIQKEKIVNHNIFARRFFHTHSTLGCDAKKIDSYWRQYLNSEKINLYSIKVVLESLDPQRYGEVIRKNLKHQNTTAQRISKNKRDLLLLKKVQQITAKYL